MNLSRDYRQPFWHGLLHAIFVVLYCIFITLVYVSINRLFNGEIHRIVQMVFSLFLVILSVAVCAYLIFYESIKRLMKHHFRAASVMMISTLGWLFIFMTIFLIGLVVTLS